MKKVWVMLVVMALAATPAMAAGIRNTKHDLSQSSQSGGKTGTIGQICVYCHTPHGGASANGAPLWNRSTTNINISKVYNTSTLNAAPNATSVEATDAILCLSCHDGASLTKPLTNPPNAGGNVPTTNITGSALIGTDLSNDHPIGFVYDDALVNNDKELESVTNVQNALGTDVFFGAGKNEMWCSSCHDVHNDTYKPFLRISNANSKLCLSC
ncbi:MAG: cytochrome C, partial [Chloroflexi bacterium]